MYCTKCGNKLNDGDLFCSNCGTKIPQSSSTQMDQQSNQGDEVQQNFTYQIQEVESSKNKSPDTKNITSKNIQKKIIILLSVAMGVSLIVLFSALVLRFKHSNNKSKVEAPEISATNSTDTPQPDKQVEQEDTDSKEETVTSSVSSNTPDTQQAETDPYALLNEFNYLSEQEILQIIDNADFARNEVLSSYMYNMDPADEYYYPLGSEYNSYDKLDKYFSKTWAKGYALVFLNEFSYCIRTSPNGYYISVGDIGWTPDILSGDVLDASQIDNQIKVTYKYEESDGTYSTDIAWIVKEDDTWKVTTPEVGKITRSDIKLKEISHITPVRSSDDYADYEASSDYDYNTSHPHAKYIDDSLDMDKALQIAKESYPHYINWTEGTFDEDAYGNPAYIFGAYDPNVDMNYGVMVLLDGTCYAHV